MKKAVIHHWRWRSPRYLITCGAKNGLINQLGNGFDPVNCKNCLRVIKSRNWQPPPDTSHQGDGKSMKFLTLSKERITTPNDDDVVYVNRWWSTNEQGEFLFWSDYSHPQCNKDKRMVEHLNRNKPDRGCEFLPVAYIPVEWNKIHSEG